MRLLSYETDQPLRQVGVLVTRPELESLIEQLQKLLATGVGYARIEDPAWGDMDISLYTDENRAFLHRRIRRLLDDGT